MRRPVLGLCLVFLAFLSACDASPTGLDVGPDGQGIPTSCESSNTVTLDVGRTAEFRGPYSGFFCVETGEGSSKDYTLIVFSTSESPVTFTARTETRSADPAAAGSATTIELDDAEATADGLVSQDPPHGEVDFHARLREWELRELTPLVGDVRPLPRFESPGAPATTPAVGEILTLNAQANPNNVPNGACESPRYVQARVEAISDRAIVVADLENPAGGFTTADYLNYAAQFDAVLAPLAEEFFGTGTDIDNNGGRTILLFTKEVNRLTPPGASSFTAGFFFARDLFPRRRESGLLGCPHSNEAEILYLMVPDPTAAFGNEFFRFSVDQITLATLIHEYQHLLNAGRRIYINGNSREDWSEEPWLNEGLSHVAEELLFYHMSGMSPRMNISRSMLSPPHVDLAFRSHQRLNFERFFEFLRSPELGSPYDATLSLATRGAAWHFLRYTVDRVGDPQAPFFRALVDSPTRGIDNLSQVLGGSDVVFDRMADWRVAIYIDDRLSGLEDRHRDLSWRLPSVHEVVRPGGYPIQTLPLPEGTPVTRTLNGGGASYLRVLGVAAESRSTIEVLIDSGLPPATLRATLIRTR